MRDCSSEIPSPHHPVAEHHFDRGGGVIIGVAQINTGVGRAP